MCVCRVMHALTGEQLSRGIGVPLKTLGHHGIMVSGLVLIHDMQTPPLSLKSCQIGFLFHKAAQYSETHEKNIFLIFAILFFYVDIVLKNLCELGATDFCKSE